MTATRRSRHIASSEGPPLGELLVSDVMHAGVLGCASDATLRDVAELMATYHIHCVVVEADDGSADWRVVSDRDVAARVAAGDPDSRSAGSAAATEFVTVEPQESLTRAAQLMHEHEVSHLVVVDRGRTRPVGVLSTLDVAAALARTR